MNECKGHTDKIKNIQWKPDSNESVFSTCSKDGSIALWDVKTGKMQRTTEKREKANYLKHVWNPEGTLFATFFEQGDSDSVAFFDYRTCKVST